MGQVALFTEFLAGQEESTEELYERCVKVKPVSDLLEGVQELKAVMSALMR